MTALTDARATDSNATPSDTDAPSVTVVEETVRVSLLGSDEVRITVEGTGTSVEDVLRRAADLLNVRLDTSRLGVVRNGEPAKLDKPVAAGDVVTGTARVRNG